MNNLENKIDEIETHLNEFDERKRKLIKKIETTKGTRIRAYNRCIYWNGMLNIMNYVFAALVVLLSIMLLTYKCDFIKYGLICLSIISLVFSLIVSNAGFEGKYRDYKDSFNRLEKLLYELNKISYNDINNLNIIENNYLTEISCSINHKDIDYFQYKMDCLHEKEGKELTKKEIEKIKWIKQKYRKYKSMEFVNKIAITLGLYAIYALFYYTIILCKKIFEFFSGLFTKKNKI